LVNALGEMEVWALEADVQRTAYTRFDGQI